MLIIFVSVLVGILVGLSIPTYMSNVSMEHEVLPLVSSSIFAFMSYWVIAASVVYGLLLSTKLLSRFVYRDLPVFHRDLAAIGLGLAGIHGTLYMLAQHNNITAFQVIIPGWDESYAEALVLGQIAVLLLVAGLFSRLILRRIGVARWNVLNVVMILAFFAASLHSILIGHVGHGDEWLVWVYSITTAVVAFLLLYRLYISLSMFCDRRRTRREDERRASIGLTN